MLDVSKATILRKIQAGEIPGKKFGRLWRLPRKKIDAWLEEESPEEGGDQEMGPETRTWLEAGLAAAAQGLNEVEGDVPDEELQGWLKAMTHAVKPLETRNV